MSPRDRVAHEYEETRDRVYQYLYHLGLTPAQSQDVTQEAFLRLYQALAGGEAIENSRAWVYRVAHNLALNLKARKQEQSASLELALPGGRAAATPSPEESLIDKEREKRLKQALRELSPQQRQCLRLRGEGLRYREIGAALGIGTSTVSEFLGRAIGRLRKAVGEP